MIPEKIDDEVNLKKFKSKEFHSVAYSYSYQWFI